MKGHAYIYKFASQLLSISHTDGFLDNEKVSAILKILPKNTETLLILHQYYHLVTQAQSKERMIVSADKNISMQQEQVISSYFERIFGRRLRIIHVIDPNLVAGIRVQIGDKIFEQSIQATLSTLQSLK